MDETGIRIQIAADAALDTLQQALKCGAECGSCLPELWRLCAGPAQPVEAAA